MSDKLASVRVELEEMAGLVTVRNHLKNIMDSSRSTIPVGKVKQANDLVNQLDSVFVEACLNELQPKLTSVKEAVLTKQELELALENTNPTQKPKKVKSK